MRVVLVSDLHIHPWQEHSVMLPSGVPSRLANGVAVLAAIRRYCLKHTIAHVIIGGDLFHKRGIVYTQAYNLVVAELAMLKAQGIEVVMVDGNHDHANKAGSVHAVQALVSADLVRGIDERRGWSNWQLSPELVVSGFSYCDDRRLFLKRLRACKRAFDKLGSGAQRIGVFHHGFQGARVGTALEYQVKEDINPRALKLDGFAYIFSGHYHTRQPIHGLKNAIYIGSPMENTRGEGGTEKGFLVYDTATRGYKLVGLPMPRFVQLTQQQIDAHDYKEVAGNYVDVVYRTLPQEPAAFVAALREQGAAGVKLAPLPAPRKTSATRLDVDLSMSPQKLMQRYMKHLKVPAAKRQALGDLGAELLDHATA